jgi:hypothetical protein
MAPTTPKPDYFLVQDGTGESPTARSPRTVKDTRGNELSLPYAPKSSCKRCYGRGYDGFNIVTNKLIACRKCYPALR